MRNGSNEKEWRRKREGRGREERVEGATERRVETKRERKKQHTKRKIDRITMPSFVLSLFSQWSLS